MECIESRKNPKANRKIIVLVVTESCNLACSYCYQNTKSDRYMPINLAKEKLAFHFNNSDKFDEIEIDLFGGEPFLNPDFIIELVEWTKNQNFKKPFIFFASTNGTKIHTKIQQWLTTNKEFIWLSLSIDGKPETQNLNRSNSYSKIDIDFFRRTYPIQDVRMTINEITLNSLYDNVIYLHELGFCVSAAFAQDVEWFNPDNERILFVEIMKLCEFYIDHPETKVCSLLDKYLPVILSEDHKEVKENKKWCGSGTSIVAIDINGNEYPCQMFMPSSMPKTCDWQEIDFTNTESLTSHDCNSCLIRNICGTCYGINIRTRGSVSKRDSKICAFNQIIALGVSYLQGNKIALGNFEKYESDSKRYKAIEAIKLIQQTYSSLYKF